jgi:lysozyme
LSADEQRALAQRHRDLAAQYRALAEQHERLAADFQAAADRDQPPAPPYFAPVFDAAAFDAANLADAVIDLSRHRSVANYQQLKAGGIAAIIHKATEGQTWQDPAYRSARDQALTHGLLWGAFHFGVSGDVPAQVDNFLSAVLIDGKLDARTLIALDWETAYTPGSTAMTVEEAENFVMAIQERTGRTPVLYTRANFVRRQFPASRSTLLVTCPLWIASWTRMPILHESWKTFYLWQYTDGNPDPAKGGPLTRLTPGIRPTADVGAACDRSFFHGTLNDLQRWWPG